MGYSTGDLFALREFYSTQLLHDTMPFWFPRSYDREYGGFLFMRDADGSLIDDDKAVWIQGRAVWTLSTLYNTIEQKPEWLEGAMLGFDFLNQHCFDGDGQMFFHVTRDGKPLRKRRYFFSETFYVIAAAAYAKASGDPKAADSARRVFGECVSYASGEKTLPPKFTGTRPSKGIGVPMIMLNTAQQLRENIGDDRCDEWIDKWIREIETFFVKDDIRCVMEQVAPEGSIINHIDGRTLNPGHAMEGAWFILHEARHRNNDPHLIDLGCRMIDYMWERGWDKEHGGILYFRDLYNKPVQEYWQDMKFWWPHNEAIIATLLAYLITGNEKYAQWHKLVHDWAYGHFHDVQHGEWFGYLHRDGTLAQSAKGNLFKGPFHLPRQEWYCRSILDSFLKGKTKQAYEKVSTGGVPAILKAENLTWGPWHELGHLHQQGAWTWSELGEVTVNIYSIAVEKAFGINPTRLTSQGEWSNTANYLARPEAERNFNGNNASVWVRLCLFQQLKLAFGDGFYHQLHRQARRETNRPTTTDARMRWFMLKACVISGKNLTSFFQKWGMKLSTQAATDAVFAEIAALGLPSPATDLTLLTD